MAKQRQKDRPFRRVIRVDSCGTYDRLHFAEPDHRGDTTTTTDPGAIPVGAMVRRIGGRLQVREDTTS